MNQFDDLVQNPEDHKDHNPAHCDYARIWLTQQFVAGTHQQYVDKLTVQEIRSIGITSAIYSREPALESIYAAFNLTLGQLFDFSEMLRSTVLDRLGVGSLFEMPNSDPALN